jgi:hypothetical protein
MEYFKKVLYLPSGGLSYPPHVWVKPVTNDLQLFQTDPNNGDSVLEYQTAIIDRYIELPTNVLNLYMQDFNYLWMYILMTEFLTQTGVYYITARCHECQINNTIFVDISKLNIQIYNQFVKPLETHYKINHENIEFIFERRRVGHSITYGNLMLNFEPPIPSLIEDDYEVDFVTRLGLYLSTQIKSIKMDGKEIPKHEYFNAFNYMLYNDVFSMFMKVSKIEEDFGIENKIQFKCKKCGEMKETYLFNDIASSTMHESIDKNIYEKQENVFSFLFSISRLPVMTYSEVLTTPMRYAERMSKALGKIEWHSGMIM